ncbi:unnamed protein product [Echinostoma caproni]|uniref:DUF5641 domain-containing protein n=1 Tax=Echinostoma caproni TaxID=27848 RepID=A0A183BFV7_9TREM|nr:unnamed protein product [Echinostoma caproni]
MHQVMRMYDAEFTDAQLLDQGIPVDDTEAIAIVESGTMFVGGRLSYANYSSNFKHPVILLNRHHVTDLIIRHYHGREEHSGDIVLIPSETTTRDQWPMGIIGAVEPDGDGLVQTAEVHTVGDKIRRDIHRLCLLEGDD